LQRKHGRALRGHKVFDVRPGRRIKGVNIIGGMCGGKHMATQIYEHATDSAFFEQWFEGALLPVVPKGYTVIMDNASFHRKPVLSLMAAKVGVRLLFLPPYSPDYNRIEHAWATMKQWLRSNMDNSICAYFAVHEYFWWQEFQYY
jgi:transposase